MSDKKIRLETLSQTSKKKKDFLLIAGIGGILALVGFSIFSFSLDVDKKNTFENRNMSALKNSKLNIVPKENIKEAWAMSVENTFKEQNKIMLQFMKEVKETRKENQKELSTLIETSQKDTEGQIFKLTEKMNKNLAEIKKDVKESLLKQDNRIEEMKLMSNSASGNINLTSQNPAEDILLDDNMFPKVDQEKKDRLLEEQKRWKATHGNNGNSNNGNSNGFFKDGKDGQEGIGADGTDGTSGIDGEDSLSVSYKIVGGKIVATDGTSLLEKFDVDGFRYFENPKTKQRIQISGNKVVSVNGKKPPYRLLKLNNENVIVKADGTKLTKITTDNGDIVYIDPVTKKEFRIKTIDGKDVIVDDQNIIVDTKVYGKSPANLTYSIIKDKDGNPIIIDRNGKALKKLKDIYGNPIKNSAGYQMYVDPETGKIIIAQKNKQGELVLTDKNNKTLEKTTNAKGETVFTAKIGGVLERRKVSFFKIDTNDVKKYALAEKQKELSDIKKRMKKKNTYHVMVGLTTGYLVTGVYAPAFSEGKMEPLPVLIQAEGDILIANDDSESLDKCFFLGSAKGNMNSQTADIRLNKISCSLANGTKKIEGSISGWVIGENGIPGVPGQLLHKNGAWLAKTFVAGFLDTFSQTLVSYAGAGGSEGSAGNVSIGDSLAGAGAESSSDVFQQIGDYYLQMAAQIFPVIEVKPGRTVDILLKGGDTLTVTDFNSAEIDQIETDIEELRAEKEADLEKLSQIKYNEKIKEINLGSGVPTSGRAFDVETKTNDLFSEGGK